MDFDDLDDLQDRPRAPARTTRFAPKSAKAPIRPPKSEPLPGPKLEVPAPKVEPGSSSDALKEPELKPAVSGAVPHKTEASSGNGAVEMELDHKLTGAKEEPMEGEEDGSAEDEVVREIDVFFNPSIDAKTQLYLVQYPLRAWWRPYELDERCEEVRVKPLSAEVEVDLPVDVESTNYDRECNSQLKMTKQTLTSSWRSPRATSYAVGVLVGNKLHLNPIHAVVQLRPSLEHLYPEGYRMKNNVTANPEGSVKTGGGEIKTGPSKKQGKQLEAKKQEADEEEHWVPLVFHGARSDLSARYVQKMVAQQFSPINFAMTPYDYVNSLCLGASTQNSKMEGSSRRALLILPLDERLKKILLEPPYAHRYSALRYYAPEVSDDNEFLSVLQQNAMLVQGCWVAKTSLLQKDSSDSQSKDSSESFARDYVLFLFSREPVIHKSVLRLPKVLSDPMKKFLNMFAVERPSLDDWKFKQPTDISFLKKYPDIVKSQNQIWETKGKTIMGFLDKRGKPNTRDGNNTNNAAQRQTNMVPKEAKSKNIDRTPSKTVSRTTMSPETREALPKALQKVFQNQKVCSFQIICERLRGLAVSQSTLPKADARMAINAANAVDSPEELIEVLNQVAVDIHGFYVLKSSPDHPEHDALRRVVINLLVGKGPKATLKKAEIVEAAKMALKRDISKNEYEKVITDLCESRGSAWILKSGS